MNMKPHKIKIPENLETDQDARKKLKQALPKTFKWNEGQGDFDYLVSHDELGLVMAKATGVGNKSATLKALPRRHARHPILIVTLRLSTGDCHGDDSSDNPLHKRHRKDLRERRDRRCP